MAARVKCNNLIIKLIFANIGHQLTNFLLENFLLNCFAPKMLLRDYILYCVGIVLYSCCKSVTETNNHAAICQLYYITSQLY